MPRGMSPRLPRPAPTGPPVWESLEARSGLRKGVFQKPLAKGGNRSDEHDPNAERRPRSPMRAGTPSNFSTWRELGTHCVPHSRHFVVGLLAMTDKLRTLFDTPQFDAGLIAGLVVLGILLLVASQRRQRHPDDKLGLAGI